MYVYIWLVDLVSFSTLEGRGVNIILAKYCWQKKRVRGSGNLESWDKGVGNPFLVRKLISLVLSRGRRLSRISSESGRAGSARLRAGCLFFSLSLVEVSAPPKLAGGELNAANVVAKAFWWRANRFSRPDTHTHPATHKE